MPGSPKTPIERSRSDGCGVVGWSAVADADGLDDRAERALHRVGVVVAHDGVAVALVAVALRRAERGELRFDHHRADELLRALEALGGDDAPAAHATQIGAARRPAPLPRAVERLVDDRARPGAIEIGVVREAHEAHELSAR